MEDWLFNSNNLDQSSEEGSDSEEANEELESRLYAINHHNDLSQPLPPELTKHYSISYAENGDIEVSLKDSLDEIKSKECGEAIQLLQNTGRKTSNQNDNDNTSVDSSKAASSQLQEQDDDDDDVVIISETNVSQERFPPKKRFRYSDVNVDSEKPKDDLDGSTTVKEIDYFNINKETFFLPSKQRYFSDLNIPESLDLPDWKTKANASYISLEPETVMSREQTIKKIFEALKKCNPQETKSKKMRKFARVLYNKARANLNIPVQNNEKQALKNVNVVNHSESTNSTPNSSFSFTQELKNLKKDIEETNYKELFYSTFPSSTPKAVRSLPPRDCKSISLNISPFRPNPPIIDLVSDNEGGPEPENSHVTPNYAGKLSKIHLPTKWSKEMIKFYTKTSKKNLAVMNDEIISNFNLTTKPSDWWLDPQDRVGIYKRTPPETFIKQRCKNCNEFGHRPSQCYKPKKTPACTLCGLPYHSMYSCPNKICLKCGVYTVSDAYGGECHSCYYNTFQPSNPCNICGEVSHRSVNCTDLWRSFHATTEGTKKIPNPQDVTKNWHRSCCNCANEGHFSEDCPFFTGQEMSSFVKNYTATASEKGSADIIISRRFSHIINGPDADQFLQNLSNSTQAEIQYEESDSSIALHVHGTYVQCSKVRYEVQEYVNTKKRKRHEPMPMWNKRRKLR